MAGGAAPVMRSVEGVAGGAPAGSGAAVYCPERGVTLLRRGGPVAAADASGGMILLLDSLSVGVDGPCSVVCRSALVTDLADVHALCRCSECVCPCHGMPADLREPG